MNGDPDLEQRYRRVLRLLPRYYRDTWEEDMVAAFLDGWLTGDPDQDSVTLEYDRPAWQELASVVTLAARLRLGGAGAPRRYFAWGQAVRGAVLAVLLANALGSLAQLLILTRSGTHVGWLSPPPGGFWPVLPYAVACAWIVIFVALVLGDRRVARIIAGPAVAAEGAAVLHAQLAGALLTPFASWTHWFLLGLAPALALASFHRDAPPVTRWPWLLALPALYVLLSVPAQAAGLTGHGAWVPDNAGICCLLVALLCLAHVPRAWSARAGTDVWSLTLVLLAAVAVLLRITSLTVYVGGDPHLVAVSLVELLITVAAAALVAPDAARTQRALPEQSPPARPSHPLLG